MCGALLVTNIRSHFLKYSIWWTSPLMFLASTLLGLAVWLSITEDPINCGDRFLCLFKFYSIAIGYGLYYMILNIFIHTKLVVWLNLATTKESPMTDKIKDWFSFIYFLSGMLFLMISAFIVVFVENGALIF